MCGDLDADMDLDIVLAQNNGPVVVLLNELPPGSASLNVDPRLGSIRGDAIGTIVTIFEHDGSVQRQEIVSGGSFLSQGPLKAHFGLGDATSVAEGEIRWAAPRVRAMTPLKNEIAPALKIILQGSAGSSDGGN